MEGWLKVSKNRLPDDRPGGLMMAHLDDCDTSIKAMHERGFPQNSCCGKNSCWVTPSKSDWNISANIASSTTLKRSYSVSDVCRIQPCRSFADVRPPKFVDLTARAYNAVFDEFVRSFSPDRFRPSGVALSVRLAILRLDQRSGNASAHLYRCLPCFGICSIDLACPLLHSCFS